MLQGDFLPNRILSLSRIGGGIAVAVLIVLEAAIAFFADLMAWLFLSCFIFSSSKRFSNAQTSFDSDDETSRRVFQ